MLDLTAEFTTFQYPVTGQINQKQISFIAVFNAAKNQKEIDDLLKNVGRFETVLEEDDQNIFEEIADRIFVGWVNLPGDEANWVREGGPESDPIECNEDRRKRLLSLPMMARMLAFAYYKSMGDTEPAKLGNSKRRHGFSSTAAAAKQ